MNRMKIKRLLERAGFSWVAGWVRNADAPKIRATIQAARTDVEALKSGAESAPRGKTDTAPRY